MHFVCYSAGYAFEINVCTGSSIKFCCNDDKLREQVKYSLSSFPEFFAYLSPLGDGKDGDDIYATLCRFQPLWRYI